MHTLLKYGEVNFISKTYACHGIVIYKSRLNETT